MEEKHKEEDMTGDNAMADEENGAAVVDGEDGDEETLFTRKRSIQSLGSCIYSSMLASKTSKSIDGKRKVEEAYRVVMASARPGEHLIPIFPDFVKFKYH